MCQSFVEAGKTCWKWFMSVCKCSVKLYDDCGMKRYVHESVYAGCRGDVVGELGDFSFIQYTMNVLVNVILCEAKDFYVARYHFLPSLIYLSSG